MRLLRNTPFLIRRNRRLLLQRTSSARRLRFSGISLQCIHRDPVLQRGFIRGVQENPIFHRSVNEYAPNNISKTSKTLLLIK